MHWAPVPTALLDDPRVRALGEHEQVVLFRLYLTARGADFVPMPRPRAGETEASVWRRVWGERAAAAVGALVEERLVACDAEGLRLAIPAGMRGATPPTADRPAPKGAGWSGKPSDGPAATRARHDRAAFKARLKGWSRVHAGVLWEEWIVTAEGAAFVAQREEDFPGYAERVTPRVTPSPRPGDALGVTPGDAGGDAPPSPPRTPPLSQRERHTERAGGDAPDGGRVTPRGDAHGDAPRMTPPATGGAALDALRDAARDVADLVGPAYERSVAAALGSARVSDADVAAMARALASPAAWWPRSYRAPAPERATLADLAGFRSPTGDGSYTCEPLLALLAHARAAARKAKAAPARPPAPPPPPGEAVTGADVRRRLAAMAAATAQENADGK